MGWERKQRGPASGYFYKSVRVPDKPYPVKLYFGRKAPAEAAESTTKRHQVTIADQRNELKAEIRFTETLERRTGELVVLAEQLLQIWLVSTGHHYHRGSWRKKRG